MIYKNIVMLYIAKHQEYLDNNYSMETIINNILKCNIYRFLEKYRRRRNL